MQKGEGWVLRGRKEEEGRKVVLLEELVGKEEATGDEEGEDPVERVDAEDAALEEVAHDGEAGGTAFTAWRPKRG